MTRGSIVRSAGWLAVAGLLGAALIAPQAAIATKPDPDHKVEICHATNSDTNPYVLENVDIASSGYLKAGHSAHTGVIWDATLKDHHIKWGDIIQPYTYGDFTYPGLNWTDAGKAILANDCNIVQPTPTPTATLPANPTVQPTATPTATPTGTVAGATSTPTGQVAGVTETLKVTAPPSDTIDVLGTASTNGWRLTLLALAGLLAAVLVLTPSPEPRRR
jgi:hypothetical protein